MKKILLKVTTPLLIGSISLGLVGCVTDKALLGINIEQTKKINQNLTKQIRLSGDIPSNLTNRDKNFFLIYTLTNNKQAYNLSKYNYARNGYVLEQRAKYYCKYAHRKFQKVYKYNFEYAPDNRSINIINNSYCPICYSNGRIKTLKGKGREKLCPFDTKTGQEITENLKNARKYITDELYQNLISFSKFKQKININYSLYKAYFYYKSLKETNEDEKIQKVRHYIKKLKEESEIAFKREEKARTERVQKLLEDYRQKNHISTDSLSIQCSNNSDSISIAKMQQNEAIAKGKGSGIALGYSMNHKTQRLNNQDITNICTRELNLENLNCTSYKIALKSCIGKLRTLSLPR